MNIESTIKSQALGVIPVVYEDVDKIQDLGVRTIQHVHAYCFYQNKIVIVWSPNKNCWTLPGGGIEVGETIEDAVIREVEEESNMKVLKQMLLGVQDIFEGENIVSQTRSLCIVEPHGPFVFDPDGDITQIKLVDPSELKQYVDWGEIGDHLLERALKMVRKMET
ncbi:MAG: NUDIX hydrolase [Minisyncoccia bacterium]